MSKEEQVDNRVPEVKVKEEQPTTPKEETAPVAPKEEIVAPIESKESNDEAKVDNSTDELIQSLQEELAILKQTKKDSERVIKEYETKEFNRLLSTNASIMGKLNVEVGSHNYDVINSVKGDFIIPEDGEVPTKEAIEHNIKLYTTLSKTNIFGNEGAKKAPIIPKTTEPIKAKIINPRLENNPLLR